MATRHYRALVDGYRWSDANGEHVSRVGGKYWLTDEQLAAAGADVFDFATEADRAAKIADDQKPAAKAPPGKGKRR